MLGEVRGTRGCQASTRESSYRTRRSASVNNHPNKLTAVNHTMSRMSMAPQRNLSLTEELEKLEQSITLTLQGTHSFAHPTITTDTGRN